MAGNLRLVPTTEILNFASKLLLDSQVRLYRSTLKMPALILDKNEKVVSRFISNNGLVEDPCAVEKERAMINPWMPEEKEIFMDKLATFGKDFTKISSFLDHKTTADCVEFYYKNHKSDCFEKTKKKLDFSKQGKSASSNTYLVTSGKKWNREMNSASLDILGAASMMAAHADDSVRNRRAFSGRLFLGGYSDSKTSWGDSGTVERPCSFDIIGNERETVAADVLAGICGSLSSDAMGSCITSSVDPGEGYREGKGQKVESVVGRPLTPDVTQIIDEGTCSDESCGEMDSSSDWTDEEKSVFIRAVSLYGRDFAMISQCVRTRSRDQCKVFFSKARKCLGLDLIHPGPGNERTSAGDEANEGGSGSEGVCVLETGSGICVDKSGLKMDEDLALSVMKHDESDTAEFMKLQTAVVSDEKNGREQEDHKFVGALEMLACDPCHKEDRPKLVSDSDSNITHCVDKQSGPLSVQNSETIFVNADSGDRVAEKGISVAESLSISEGNDPVTLNPETGVGLKSVDEVSSDGLGNHLGERDKNNGDGQSALHSVSSDSNSSGSASHSAADRSSSSGFSLNCDYQHQVSAELNSMEKPYVVSLPQEASHATDSAIDQREKTSNVDKLSPTLDFQEGRDTQHDVSVCRDECRDHVTCIPITTNTESPQVLRGYPLQMPTKEELNGDVSCRNLSEVHNTLKLNRSIKSHFTTQEYHLHKCNSSKTQHSFADFPLVSQKKEMDHPKIRSHSLSDSEKPSRNGDVKLFGQILTNPSSMQKANSSSHVNEEKGSHHHRSSNKSTNLKFSSHHSSDGNSGILKFDHNNFLGLENVPVRSYGFWDGSRIQPAYPSLPDSAILLAKYPAAFSNYPTSSSKVEQQQQQQPLQAVVKSNERNVNGVSVFPTREISNGNGVVDYQVYRSRDGTKVQPFTVDVKQRQDIFSELQRRNGFEAISSLQQQGRGMVGVNVVSRGGIIVGGPCTGVSDPVAAIKMHYAKSDHPQYGGGQAASSIIREDESWRGSKGGDIGR